jgi:methionine synthase II (cobalamin-independent)
VSDGGLSSSDLFRWPQAGATGVGSLPGTAAREAVQLVIDEVGALPHLPELPARGPGGDMAGRALALLPDFPAAWGPTGWALADRPGRETRRSAAFLGEDLDVAEELLTGWSGPFKVQLCGPWTLAASIELRSGRKILGDPGARRDLHQAYADAVAGHAAEVLKRLPGVALLVQLDEPGLPYVLDGSVPTPSGLTRLAAIDEQEVLAVLAAATASVASVAAGVAGVAGQSGGARTGVHCCAASPPLRLLRQLHDIRDDESPGLGFASVDGTLLTPADDDAVGEALEAGLLLMLGLVPTSGATTGPAVVADAASSLRQLWRRLGLPVEQLTDVVVTPTCGLAGATMPAARAALAASREVARQIADDPEADPHG